MKSMPHLSELRYIGYQPVFDLLMHWVMNDRQPSIEVLDYENPQRDPFLFRICLYNLAQQTQNVKLMNHIISDLILNYDRFMTTANALEIVHAFWVTGSDSSLTAFMATCAADHRRRGTSDWDSIKQLTDVKGEENGLENLVNDIDKDGKLPSIPPMPAHHCEYHTGCRNGTRSAARPWRRRTCQIRENLIGTSGSSKK
jgi:hypothetical protein